MGELRLGWGILGNSLFFLLNVLAIALMGRLIPGAGEDACRRGGFRQLCCGRW